MPLTVYGELYRDFSEPRFFECETTAQVRQIRMPADKSHALVSADDGSTSLLLWKFNLTSTAAASATILVPINPAYAVAGRWIKIPLGSGGGGDQYVFAGNYGGSAPTDVPDAAAAIGIDTSNGMQWQWYAGAWH